MVMSLLESLINPTFFHGISRAGGKGSILVMSKVPIFRISKSKFLLFQEW